MPIEFAALARRLDRLHPAHLERGVGDVALDRADGDGAVAGLLDHAIAFAQPVLRADAAADLGEGVGGGGRSRRPLPAAPRRSASASRGCCCGAGNGPGRTARRIASSGWPGPSARGRAEPVIDLLEILAPQAGLALVRHGLADGHELQHPWRHLRDPQSSPTAPPAACRRTRRPPIRGFPPLASEYARCVGSAAFYFGGSHRLHGYVAILSTIYGTITVLSRSLDRHLPAQAACNGRYGPKLGPDLASVKH